MGSAREQHLNIDANFDLWLPIPTTWPWQHHSDVDAWAQAVAQAFGDAYEWNDAVRTWCADFVTSLSKDTPEGETRLAIIDPGGEWLFFLSVVWAPSDGSLSVDELAAADDENAIRGIEVTEFPTKALGRGIRTVRYVDDQTDTHSVVGIIQHGFQAKGLDIMVVSSHYDVILLQELAPEIDTLVHTISVD